MTTFLAGQRLTASQLLAAVGTTVRKGTDQSVTSSTTLQNDTALVLPLVASATYEFRLDVLYKGGTLGSSDLKPGWSLPSGAVLAGSTSGIGTGSTAVLAGQVSGSTWNPTVFGTDLTGVLLSFLVIGTVVTSATAGNLQWQWAQNTSNATATTVMAGSSLFARRTA